MATIGQIVYNIEDYQNSGGRISTSSSRSGTVKSSDYANYEDYKKACLDITKDIVNGNTYSKLGIQAPAGTKVVINGKNILIGRTGIYELDDEIEITSLYFEQVSNYVLDSDATQTALDGGYKGIKQAEENRASKIKEIEDKYQAEEIVLKEYLKEYQQIQSDYLVEYLPAYEQLQQGINGIYIADGYEELQNIIIDYVQ